MCPQYEINMPLEQGVPYGKGIGAPYIHLITIHYKDRFLSS